MENYTTKTEKDISVSMNTQTLTFLGVRYFYKGTQMTPLLHIRHHPVTKISSTGTMQH